MKLLNIKSNKNVNCNMTYKYKINRLSSAKDR